MKKTILSIIAVVAACIPAFADTTLAEAYRGLANLSGMTEKNIKTVSIDDTASITNAKVSSVVAAPCDVQLYRDYFTYMTENLPVRQMVLGANNMNDMAFVYATPNGTGKYNVLMIVGDASAANFVTIYGQTSKAGVDAISNCSLTMDAQSLTAAVSGDAGSQTFFTMSE